MNERAGEEVDTERAGNRGDRGYGRSQLIHMPDVTITLLIYRDSNTDKRYGGPKQRHQRKWLGRVIVGG